MLNAEQRKKAQRDFRLYLGFNVVSFSLITGNVLFLYAIRLGAETRLIGFLSALGSISFVFSLFSRKIIRKLGVVKTRGYFWLFRYISMIPVLGTAFPTVRSNEFLSLSLITLGFFGFNFFKGIALAGTKPILGNISQDSDRASFVSGNNMITFTGQIVTGLFMFVMLGTESPLHMYVIFMALGIITGFFASAYSLKQPEPESAGPGRQTTLLRSFRTALRKPEFSRLLYLVIFSNLAIGMAIGFIVLYAKTVYKQPDSLVIFFTVAGALGAMAMAAISRFMTDRVGSKPMYFFWTGLRLIFIAPIVIAPVFANSWATLLFMLLLFFLNQMSIWGLQSTADLYFFATTGAENRLDFGIVFNIARGISGMVGSLGGGFILNWLQKSVGTEGAVLPFQIYFSIAAVFLVINLFLIPKLPDVSDFSITDLLSIIFSPRNLRAIYFLNRLKKSSTTEEEQKIVTAMGSSKSLFSMQELQRRITSPSYFIRMNAITGLANFPADADTIRLLIDDIRLHPFTTAHMSADRIGILINNAIGISAKMHSKVQKSMLQALESGDYLLKSKAALVLGQMGISDSTEIILHHFKTTENPREIIYYAKALSLLKADSALPVIFEKIGTETYPHITDDLTIIAASLLGMEEWFYPFYLDFLSKSKSGFNTLLHESARVEMYEDLQGLYELENNESAAEKLKIIIEKLNISNSDKDLYITHTRRFILENPQLIVRKLRFLFAALLVYHVNKR
jgi:MFS family permease